MTARELTSKGAPRILMGFCDYYFSRVQLVYGSKSVPVPVWSTLKASGSDIPFPMIEVI
jgi:hypothetical protein